MTDEEFIQAFEWCGKADCVGCPHIYLNCRFGMIRRAFDLLNRQQAEIDSLKREREVLIEDIHHSADQINEQIEDIERLQKENNQFADIGKMYSEIKAETIKNLAERFESKLNEIDFPKYAVVEKMLVICKQIMNDTVKEMVGEDIEM